MLENSKKNKGKPFKIKENFFLNNMMLPKKLFQKLSILLRNSMFENSFEFLI